MLDMKKVFDLIKSHLKDNEKIDEVDKIYYQCSETIIITNKKNKKQLLIIDDVEFINIVLFADKKLKKHLKGDNINIDISNLEVVLLETIDEFIKEI